jgi:hypothetical protein
MQEVKYRQVLQSLYNILGPDVPSCLECDGCRFEWQEALDILNNALGDVAEETMTIVGVKDGVETVLGEVPLSPQLKAKEIVRGYFSDDVEEDGTEASFAYYAMLDLIKWMEKRNER